MHLVQSVLHSQALPTQFLCLSTRVVPGSRTVYLHDMRITVSLILYVRWQGTCMVADASLTIWDLSNHAVNRRLLKKHDPLICYTCCAVFPPTCRLKCWCSILTSVSHIVLTNSFHSTQRIRIAAQTPAETCDFESFWWQLKHASIVKRNCRFHFLSREK